MRRKHPPIARNNTARVMELAVKTWAVVAFALKEVAQKFASVPGVSNR